MSTEVIEGLLAKRAELVGRVHSLQSRIYHLDGALAVMGDTHAPSPRPQKSNFANPELVALVGAAERDGADTAVRIARYIMQAKV